MVRAARSTGAAARGHQPRGGFFARLARRFGYDAVDDAKRRRRPARTDLRSEEHILPSAQRRKIVATARDVVRNHATAAWMIRCHLDYVTRFEFQCRTGDEALDAAIETFIWRAGLRGNFDVGGRYGLPKALRISEARRVIDGDVFWAKLAGGRVQLIEGDRIRTPHGGLPEGYAPADFVEGVQVSAGGRLQAVCVCARNDSGGYAFERILPARNVWQHACWDTTYRVDQVRGVTPLSTALATLQDIYEGIDLAFAKAKVAQMFGLSIYRQELAEREGWGSTLAETTDADRDGDDDATGEPAADSDRYEIDPGAGPFKLELEPGDRAEFLSTNTPETELLSFLAFTTDLSIKSLDIPSSMWDSKKANYYGQKADIQKYENSAKSKREDNQQLLDEWTAWRLRLAILGAALELPGRMTLKDVLWEWIPTGMPWIDKLRDMKADQLALQIGSDSEIRIARRAGQDAYELARERMDYEAFVRDERTRRGLPPLAATAAAASVPEADETKGDDNA